MLSTALVIQDRVRFYFQARVYVTRTAREAEAYYVRIKGQTSSQRGRTLLQASTESAIVNMTKF